MMQEIVIKLKEKGYAIRGTEGEKDGEGKGKGKAGGGALIKRNGFAIVTHLISSGTEIAQFMRERTAGQIKRLHTKYGVRVLSTPTRLQAQQQGVAPTPQNG